METKILDLLSEIKASRLRLIESVSPLTNEQGAWKPSPDAWSIQEITEHLVYAEQGGFNLIYTAAERYRQGNPVFSGTSENDGLSIEEIIDRTWRSKETAPPSATPRGQWDLAIWCAHLDSCDHLLSYLRPVLDGLPLDKIIYPHFLCGPLNVYQRLEFIRFHSDRHHEQVKRTKKELGL